VLVRELAALYATRSGRTVPPLPAADDFAAYALEQVAQPGGAAFAADEAYWLSRFAGEVPVLDLPVDRARPARRGFASSRQDHALDAGLVAALRAMGAHRGVSLFAVLLTGFAGLLARLTGQSRVVVGIPTAGQSVDGHEHLVGHCVNTLPLLFDLDLAQPVSRALDDAQATLLDALEHQRYTFGTLLRKLHVARDPSRLPLVSVMLNIDQALDQETAAFPGLEMDFSSNARSFENFELSVNAVQAHGELRLECQFNSDLFDVDTVRRWMAYWQTLLQGMVAAGEAQAFGSLPLLAEADRRQLGGFNDTAVDYPRDVCIHQLIEAQVAKTPDAVALSHEGETLSYTELNARANRLAHHLRGLGVRPDDRVAICAERGPAMVTGLLAILKSGGAYVPFDPEYPAARLKGMLEDCQPVAILTEQALRGTVEALEPTARVVALDADAADWAQQPATNPSPGDAGLAATHLAYVIYTSGSTGTPKGAMNEHRGVVNRLLWMQDMFGLDAHDAVLQKTPFSFDVSVWEFFWPLLSGARLVMARAGGHKDPAYLADTVRREGITTMHFVPSMLRTFVDGADLGACAALKRVVCSGEALPAKLADDVGRLLPGVGLHNLYGPTEAAVDVTAWTCVPGQASAGVPIGRPVANTRIYILDDFGQPVPVGVAGEIFIGGVQVGRGYLNRAELTRERFLADPFAGEDGARMYKTGDLGRWRADGNIEYLGRNDFQVKLRGFRIELGEIEKAIADHADVAQAVVIAREDHPGDVRLVAYVVPCEGTRLDEAGMRAHLKQRLPDYMVPAHFVTIDAVPLLANGKMDRKALPAPVVESVAAGSARMAPRDDRERRVAAAMEAVLALPELDVRDDFFALGGHSLLAAQLTARLSREFGIALSFRTLFDAPTIADLAAAIGSQMDSGAVPALQAIPRRATQDRAPLSLMQKRLWALDDLQPGRVTYNAPSAHRLRGHLDEAAFERAFREMMQRQAVMRTSMQRSGEDVEQVVAEQVPVQLFPAEDLSALPAERREAELMQRMQALADTPFELSRAPLFSVRMFRMADDEHVFFFMPHHIIWDGWSFDILDAELSQL
jgi:amino acid adenylation domain-containing protein